MGKVSRRIRILIGIAAGTTAFGFGLFYNSLAYLLEVNRLSTGVLLELVRNPSANLTEYWNGWHLLSSDVAYFVYSQYREIHDIIFWMYIGLVLFSVGIAMIVGVGIEELKEKIDKLEAKLSQQTTPEK
jgi:hypothetical protein